MASDIKWIKVCTDIFDDEKILLIESMPESDSIIVIWFKLLCLAGKQNNGGVFTINDKIAYTDEMLASIFRRPLNTIRLALKTFEAYGMIEIVQGTITIPMWEKHQSTDKMERIREQNRERAAAFRARQKQLTQACDDTSTQSNVTVTLRNATELDKELELDKDIDNKEKNSIKKESAVTRNTKFVKPTVEQVKAYCQERKNLVDANRFVDYYEANGWKVGRNSMKDWKAAVRTWERTEGSKQHESRWQTLD